MHQLTAPQEVLISVSPVFAVTSLIQEPGRQRIKSRSLPRELWGQPLQVSFRRIVLVRSSFP